MTTNHTAPATEPTAADYAFTMDLKPRELLVGDIAFIHGMIIEVTNPVQLSGSHESAHGGCWWTSGLVLNPKAARAGQVGGLLGHDNRWTIQSNDLAGNWVRVAR